MDLDDTAVGRNGTDHSERDTSSCRQRAWRSHGEGRGSDSSTASILNFGIKITSPSTVWYGRLVQGSQGLASWTSVHLAMRSRTPQGRSHRAIKHRGAEARTQRRGAWVDTQLTCFLVYSVLPARSAGHMQDSQLLGPGLRARDCPGQPLLGCAAATCAPRAWGSFPLPPRQAGSSIFLSAIRSVWHGSVSGEASRSWCYFQRVQRLDQVGTIFFSKFFVFMVYFPE